MPLPLQAASCRPQSVLYVCYLHSHFPTCSHEYHIVARMMVTKAVLAAYTWVLNLSEPRTNLLNMFEACLPAPMRH